MGDGPRAALSSELLGRGLQHDAHALAPLAVGVAGSMPSTLTSPAVRLRNPSRISTVVDLPAPLGPSKAKTSPVVDLEVEPVDGVLVAVVLA